jgi:hypothetical protein
MRAGGLAMLVVLGCASSKGEPDAAVASADVSVSNPPDVAAADVASPAPDTAPAIDPALAAQVRSIAAEYPSWGRVDDELRWAPGLCRIPLPGVPRMSASDDGATHGRKLYSVFVKHHDTYPQGPHTGQVVVKESWLPEPADPSVMYDPEKLRAYPDGGDHFYPYARNDAGMIFRAAAPAGLYIMFKVDPAPPDSDGGWIYATITAAGQLTAAGRIPSCIGCHQEAEHDRLFGVPKSPRL